MFQIILSAFKQTFQHKKTITLLYVINLILALVLAIPFFWFLKTEAGSSMEIAKLLPNFDDTVFSDFMHQAGKTVENYLWQGLWLALFSGIVSIFLAGGILEDLKTTERRFPSGFMFFGNCGKYFRRFCWLTIFKAFLLLLLFFIYALAVSVVTVAINSEVGKFLGFFMGTFILGFIALLVILANDYAQIALVQDDSNNTSKALGIGWNFVFKHFLKVNLLAVILFIGFCIATYLYWVLEKAIGMTSAFTILVILVIQQCFIWLKMAWRVWFFASEMNYFMPIYTKNRQEVIEKMITQLKIEQEKAEQLRLQQATENTEIHNPENE